MGTITGIASEDTSQPDIVTKPAHYTRNKIEPVEFIMANDLPFHIGNIVKYAVRAGYKIYDGMNAEQSEIADLKKVARYAEMRIAQLMASDDIGWS